jgi:hypothetical protein
VELSLPSKIKTARLMVGNVLDEALLEPEQVLARRWIVERTFGWLMMHRRLVRDYEMLPETSEAFVQVAMIRIMLNRLDRMAS